VFNDESGDGVAQAGETISYFFDVTNTGSVTLAPVAVSDPSVSPITCPGGNPIPSLAPGAMVTCTATYTILAGDVAAGRKDNTATATGQDPGANPIESTDMETTPLPGAAPMGVVPTLSEWALLIFGLLLVGVAIRLLAR
jgi:hypothetical protein